VSLNKAVAEFEDWLCRFPYVSVLLRQQLSGLAESKAPMPFAQQDTTLQACRFTLLFDAQSNSPMNSRERQRQCHWGFIAYFAVCNPRHNLPHVRLWCGLEKGNPRSNKDSLPRNRDELCTCILKEICGG
jgi:hypothetical protein